MKTLKFTSLILVLFFFGYMSHSQTIELTITDINYTAGDYYDLHYAIYDYTQTPTLQYWDNPNPYLTINTGPNTYSNITVPWTFSKDVEAAIFEIKIRVYKNGTVYRDDTSGLLNSDGYYAGNIPLSVSF